MEREERLDGRSLRALERMLIAKRATLRECLRRAVMRRTSGAGGRPDEATWAGESLQREMEAALVDQRSQEVAQIDAALDRLARGEYGLCHDCDGFIGLERLRALPFARRCTPCQAGAERRRETTARRAAPAVAGLTDDD